MSDILHSLAVVPGAGRSERFGGMKLVADVDGEPLLDRTLRSLLDGGIDRVVVVLAPGASFPTVPLLCDHRVTIAVNPDPSRGMFSSIQAGLEAAAGDPIAVLPADMPFVRPRTVAALLDACARLDAAVVPMHEGHRGHPLILPARLRDALRSADPLASLKDALGRLGVSQREITVEDPGVLRDVDRREDLDTGAG
jgi:molybdenum cofactor cytidylyltransferase